MAIYEHRQALHKASSENAMVADFSVLYKAAFLKGSKKLFSTREALEKRISPVIKRWKRRFTFKCFACQSYFENVENLRNHNVRWCQMLHSAEFKSKLFPENDPSASRASNLENSAASENSDLTTKEIHEKMNEHLAHLEALSMNCSDCQKIGLDYRAHLVHHGRDARSKKKPLAVSAMEKTPEPLLLLPKSIEFRNSDESENHSTTASLGSRITRQRLEAHSLTPAALATNKVTKLSKKAAAKAAATATKTTQKGSEESTPQQPLKATKVEADEETTQTPKVALGKKRKNKATKAVLIPNAFVEALGIDVPSERHLLSFNRISKKALAFGATAKKASSKNEKDKKVRKFCALCDFSSEFSEAFASHIRIHKPIINREVVKGGPAVNFNEASEASDSDCLQCKECGMCFASEPSWKKHLFLLHRIKKPQASDYCTDLNAISDDDHNSNQLNTENHEYGGKEKCNVCGVSFNSELELRRHFRSHGMAFITQKPLESLGKPSTNSNKSSFRN